MSSKLKETDKRFEINPLRRFMSLSLIISSAFGITGATQFDKNNGNPVGSSPLPNPNPELVETYNDAPVLKENSFGGSQQPRNYELGNNTLKSIADRLQPNDSPENSPSPLNITSDLPTIVLTAEQANQLPDTPISEHSTFGIKVYELDPYLKGKLGMDNIENTFNIPSGSLSELEYAGFVRILLVKADYPGTLAEENVATVYFMNPESEQIGVVRKKGGIDILPRKTNLVLLTPEVSEVLTRTVISEHNDAITGFLNQHAYEIIPTTIGVENNLLGLKFSVGVESELVASVVTKNDGNVSNVRSESNIDSSIVEQVRPNEQLRLVDENLIEGEWYKVVLSNDKEGYIHQSRVDDVDLQQIFSRDYSFPIPMSFTQPTIAEILSVLDNAETEITNSNYEIPNEIINKLALKNVDLSSPESSSSSGNLKLYLNSESEYYGIEFLKEPRILELIFADLVYEAIYNAYHADQIEKNDFLTTLVGGDEQSNKRGFDQIYQALLKKSENQTFLNQLKDSVGSLEISVLSGLDIADNRPAIDTEHVYLSDIISGKIDIKFVLAPFSLQLSSLHLPSGTISSNANVIGFRDGSSIYVLSSHTLNTRTISAHANSMATPEFPYENTLFALSQLFSANDQFILPYLLLDQNSSVYDPSFHKLRDLFNEYCKNNGWPIELP